MYLLIQKRRLVLVSPDNKSNKVVKVPPQRKTTLKWGSDGELSSVDMARILYRLENPELTECDLTCGLKDSERAN